LIKIVNFMVEHKRLTKIGVKQLFMCYLLANFMHNFEYNV
jgi:hypothetical protein